MDFLRQKGLLILDHNVHVGHYEVDIIAQDQEDLVFVEVKSLWSPVPLVGLVYRVHRTKQLMLWKAAWRYVQQHQRECQTCRFDVITIHFLPDRALLRYYPCAFEGPAALPLL